MPRLLLALSDIKLAHSVFALPFAVLAAFMVAPRGVAGDIHWGTFGGQLALVVVAMVLARTWAMLVNRLADRAIDAANPRTARRVFASGRLSPREGWAVALVCALLFVLVAAAFLPLYANPWPLVLSGPVLAWIAFYSFTKRFTFLAHLFLGGALAASPLAAAIAVDGLAPFTEGLATTGGSILALAGFVALWVAGFDVAYALQDVEFDRERGLHSVPSRFGVRRALIISAALHALALLVLAWAWDLDPRFGTPMAVGVALVAALLVFEHLVLRKRGVAGLPIAFFTVNGVVSVLLGCAGVVDVWGV